MARRSTKTAEPKTEAVKDAPITSPAAKEDVKAAVKGEAAPAVKEVPAKNEVKSAEKKPAAKKTTAAKKPAAKKTTEKAAAKKTDDKTAKVPAKAAEKPEAKAAAKPAAKRTRTAKPADDKAEPTAKRGGRKPKEVTIEDICAKVAKRSTKAKAAKITGVVAAEFKIYGWDNSDENHKFMYIEVKDGKLTVAPFNYDDCTLKADIPLADIIAFADGKLSLKDAKIYAAGNFGDALKLASLFE